MGAAGESAKSYALHSLDAPNLGQNDSNVSETIYVDSEKGIDANSGISREKPLKTIRGAIKRALMAYSNGSSTRIRIAPGTYREFVQISGKGLASGPRIAIEATVPGTVIVSGADAWTDWRKSEGSPGEYTHTWYSLGGQCKVPPHWPEDINEIVLRREMVIVDQNPMRQVLSRAELVPGTFFVDDSGGLLYLRVAPEQDLSRAMVEVAVRPKLLSDDGLSGLLINGITFEKASTCLPGAAVQFFNTSDSRIENCTFRWNNFHGLELHGVSNVTVKRVVATHNGGAGFHGFQLKNVIYEDDEASYNNWRGASGHFFFWDVAGAKLMWAHGVSVTRFQAFSNQSVGLWFDTDDRDVVVSGSNLSQNSYSGLFLEANQGPIRIEDTRICSNGAEGLRILNSEKVSIQNSILYGNKITQMFLDGRVKSRNGNDWETHEPFAVSTKDFSLAGNTIVATEANQLLMSALSADSGVATAFINSLSSGKNTWFSPQPAAFKLEVQGDKLGQPLGWESWHALVSRDETSIFRAPKVSQAEVCGAP
jgi:hypothetical protein